MPSADPLITPEELQCLLGGASAQHSKPSRGLWHAMQSVHWGALLWLVKGVFLYAVLMGPEAASVLGGSRYLWMRSGLELLCLAAFWGAALHPRGHNIAKGSMLVASTTLLMDAMILLAFSG
jgi:hypothetical protein